MLSLSFADLAEAWNRDKTWLSKLTGLSADALHVHTSILLMLAAAVVWRRRVDHAIPWLTVFAAELVNEALDLSAPANGENTIHASLHDIYNTMFLPTVILLCLRFTRSWRRA